VTDLWELYLEVVHWMGRTSDRVVDGLGLGGGAVDGALEWVFFEADVVVAAVLATVIMALWVMAMGGVAVWLDRLMRAWVEGRLGTRYRGPMGVLQGLADWVKLMLRKRGGMPSAALPALSGALVLGAFALLPLGPWGRLVDPDWGVLGSASLLALSGVPLAAMAPAGRRHAAAAETAGTGVVLLLAVASVVLIAGEGSSAGLVDLQEGSAWGVALVPLAFVLYLVVMHWESQRLGRARTTSAARECWPSPHMAVTRYVLAVRYLTLGVMGSIVFLGGWTGPFADGLWWTLLKAYVLVMFASAAAAVGPLPRPAETAGAVRSRWLPLAAVNLVVVAAVLEVMA
jgi:NADH-quinone oxidoreductase subunit H